MTVRRRTVLHVVDRTGGGVPIAASTYIRNSPEEFHHAVLAPLSDPDQEEFWRATGAEVHPLRSRSHLKRIAEVHSVCAEVDPDVIHAHSSYAGAYARLAIRKSRKRSIVYTPHCYSFERTDLGPLARAALYAVEGVLAWNTTTVAACSERERGLAKRLNPTVRSIVIPNVSSVSGVASRNHHDGNFRIGMIGRISPQKAPAEFIRAVESAQSVHPTVSATWIGDGNAKMKTDLIAAGIHVTGWIRDGAEIRERILELDVYLHTAAWEGFPIALLDALRFDVPALASNIKAFADLPAELTIEGGMEKMLSASTTTVRFDKWRQATLMRWAEYLTRHTPREQTRMLREAWQVRGRA